MIHDATVEVTCDGEGCQESIYIKPHYVYMSTSGAGGHYDTSDAAIEKHLPRDGWVVQTGGGATLHYCCQECANPEASHAE